MNKVFQDNTQDGSGNCMSACVASLLDLTIEEVPNFRLAEDPWNALQEWLAEMGLCAIQVQAVPDLFRFPDIHFIVSGKSPRRNGLHAIVAKNQGGEMIPVHDPFPGGDCSLRTIERITFIGKTV